MVYQIIFAGGLVFMKDVNPMWHWMFEVLCRKFDGNNFLKSHLLQISFMKHALDGYISLILGFDRAKMECEEVYCHFVSPQKFMSEIDNVENIPKVFYSLATIWAIFHVITYCIMRYRLRH